MVSRLLLVNPPATVCRFAWVSIGTISAALRLREASRERIKQHAQLSFRAADDRRLGDERHLLHRVVHLRHEPPQA